MADQQLPGREENFAEWYNQIVLRAELADYPPCGNPASERALFGRAY